MTTATKLPEMKRPVSGDPEYLAAIEALLKPYKGEALGKAQAAVEAHLRSGATGSYHDHLDMLKKAIAEAIEGD